ncbi:unnamed protein product [Trifolium pratense]|uniref:Uncharacterized protein n=1 Tax=Trifolium pratense TaxID=57577 RepID=A0ACB0LZ15_TRIPR|nr:unnamed protein product [Trifolium pratense]
MDPVAAATAPNFTAQTNSISVLSGTNFKRLKKTAGNFFQNKKTREQSKESTCFFCKKAGHMKKDCSKYASWREKKGNFLTFVCSEINLVSVPKDTWWVDSGATTHISMSMQGCLWSRPPSDAERFIYVGDGNKVAVEAIGTFRLLLKTGFHLDLVETFVAPSIRRNLISISILDKSGYTCSFGNNKFSLSYDSNVVGYGSLNDNLYMLDIECPYNKIMQVESHGSWNGQRYFITFIDDYSRYGYLYLIHEKSQSLDVFKSFKAEVELQLGKKIKAIKSDRGGEYYETDPEINNDVIPNIPQEQDNAEFLPQAPPTVQTQQPQELPLRRSTRERKCPISDDYVIFLQEHEDGIGLTEDDPINFSQAMRSSNSLKWIDAMKDEMKSMTDNDVWDLVKLPEGKKPIGCKWIFKTKRDSKGNIERYKARLVAKGFTQKEGIDYKETFSPVSSKDSLRIIMALVAHFDLELHQMDVKTAFLNGNIEETIYMVQPENFVSGDPKSVVCKLKKSIYGLRQASRQWYCKFHQVISSFGFEANPVDDCIYQKFSGSKFVFLVLYVDDILLASNNIGLLHETKRFLTKNFEMKDLRDASFVLGIRILRDRSQGILGLSQRSYIDTVLDRFSMKDSKPGDTPVARGDKFSLNQCPTTDLEKKEMHKVPYASAVGSLMYAQSDNLEIIGYSDSDYAGCPDSKRSTSGYIFLLAGGAVSWKSVKQSLVAPSTMAAEFVACFEASNHANWLRNFVTGLRIIGSIERPLKIYCDNSAAVFYSNNNMSSTKSKFIDIKYLVVKERVQEKQLLIEHIGTDLMLADPLTKGLTPKAFHGHVARMGLGFEIALD